jgi:hypothetical protein
MTGQPRDQWNRVSNQHFMDWLSAPKKDYGYLSIKGQNPREYPYTYVHHIEYTTWMGQILGKGVLISQHISNFGDERFYFRVRHPETNEVYSGWGNGNGMLCRVHKTKIKHLLA